MSPQTLFICYSNVTIMRFRWIILFCTIIVGIVWCWDVLADMGSRRLGKDGYVFKNEYIFGDCKNPKKIYYEKQHKTVHEVQRASVIRDWLLEITRIPTCIIIRADSYETNAFRLTYYNFEICVPRVSFCYNKKRWNYYYYEWYIPKGITYGSDWDLYFYGPNKSDWTLQWG